jgi:hypothetical protein
MVVRTRRPLLVVLAAALVFVVGGPASASQPQGAGGADRGDKVAVADGAYRGSSQNAVLRSETGVERAAVRGHRFEKGLSVLVAVLGAGSALIGAGQFWRRRNPRSFGRRAWKPTTRRLRAPPGLLCV